jgi:rhodanese-related sulfurtransferase
MGKTTNILLFVLLAIIFSSCMEDVVETVEAGYSNSADLITYVETRTNYFNGEDNPQLVTVDELKQNLGTYYIIDIRDKFEFRSGHIPTSLNVPMKHLLSYLKEHNAREYQKIIIVSSTGQLASYASSLLNLAGFTNVFPLDRGMTYWNRIFSSELRNAQSTSVNIINETSIKPKVNYSSTYVLYTNSPKTIEEKIENRVQLLLSTSPFDIFISAKEFHTLYSYKIRGYKNSFLIYSIPDSILHRSSFATENRPREIRGPISLTVYDTRFEFNTNKYLFTIPTDKNVVLYSPNGQRSAYLTAYLQLIGFKAFTIKYGCINMMHKEFIGNFQYIYHPIRTDKIIGSVYIPAYLTNYGFVDGMIRNYAFEVGE